MLVDILGTVLITTYYQPVHYFQALSNITILFLFYTKDNHSYSIKFVILSNKNH